MALQDKYIEEFKKQKSNDALRAMYDAWDANMIPKNQKPSSSYGAWPDRSLDTPSIQTLPYVGDAPQPVLLSSAVTPSSPYALDTSTASAAAGTASMPANTQVTYQTPDGQAAIGYIIDGRTYKDPQGTQRIDPGSLVYAGGELWEMTPAGGVLYSQLHPSETTNIYGGNNGYGGMYGNNYISNIYNSLTDAKVAELDSTYEQNVNTLNASKENIPGQYQEARNAAAGQAAVQRGNFNEYAAASGLNSGAGGQAQLAFSNTLQGNLSGLDKAQANALAELDLQMANLETNYRSAVQQAIAQGEFEKAQALYNDYQLERDRLISQKQFDETMALNRQQFGLTQQQYQNSRSDTALNQAFLMYEVTGDISFLKPYMADEQIARLEAGRQPVYTPARGPSNVNDGFSTDVMPTPSWAQPQPRGAMIDPGLVAALTDKGVIRQTVWNMANNGKSPSYISSYLKHLQTAGAISQKDYDAIMSSLSW